MRKLSPEEEEGILESIRAGKTLPVLLKESGKSKSLLYRIASENSLEIVKEPRESVTSGRDEPYSQSDKVVIAHTKSFIKGISKKTMEDILFVGQLIHRDYADTAKKYGVSLEELTRTAMTFFLEESIMVEAYKAQIQHNNREIQALKAQMDTTTMMRDHIRELATTMMLQGRPVDYESIFNSAKAVVTMAGEIQAGEYDYERGKIDRDGGPDGHFEGRGNQETPDGGDTGTDPDGADEPAPSPTTPDPELLRDDAGDFEFEDDGKDAN